MLPGDGVDGVLTELPSLGCGFLWEGSAVVLPELTSLRVGCANKESCGGVLPELLTNRGDVLPAEDAGDVLPELTSLTVGRCSPGKVRVVYLTSREVLPTPPSPNTNTTIPAAKLPSENLKLNFCFCVIYYSTSLSLSKKSTNFPYNNRPWKQRKDDSTFSMERTVLCLGIIYVYYKYSLMFFWLLTR